MEVRRKAQAGLAVMPYRKKQPGNAGRRLCFTAWLEELEAERPPQRPLFAIGRLDKDTSGLLLVTDDGLLSFGVISPGRVAKSYVVTTNARPTDEAIARLLEGVDLEDGFARAVRVEILSVQEWDHVITRHRVNG